jgi:hypothetical protein
LNYDRAWSLYALGDLAPEELTHCEWRFTSHDPPERWSRKTRLRSSITASAFEKHIAMSKAWRGFAKR